MSQRGLVIDGLEFARHRESMSGRVGLDGMPRLAEMLFDVADSLVYEISGEFASGAAFLTLRLDGTLRLTCQRCLGPLDYPLTVRNRVMLLSPGSPWPEDDQVGGLEDESCDAIEAPRQLDLVPLLEEEALLALPIAPRHEHCQALPATAARIKASPFTRLAKLKRN
jgi:uncharacterized protein